MVYVITHPLNRTCARLMQLSFYHLPYVIKLHRLVKLASVSYDIFFILIYDKEKKKKLKSWLIIFVSYFNIVL